MGPHVSRTPPSLCAHGPNVVWGTLEYLMSVIDSVADGVTCVAGPDAAKCFFLFLETRGTGV